MPAPAPRIWAATIQPGFDKHLIAPEVPVLPRENGALYSSTFAAATGSFPHLLFINSWSEWWEHSYIEASALYGNQYPLLTRQFSRSWKQASFSLPFAHANDFDGDRTSDIALFRPRTSLWALRGLTRFYFGNSNDLPVPGDYDGGGTRQAGICRWQSNLWAARNVTRFYFGEEGDLPIPADCDGNGRDEGGIFRPRTSLWALRYVTRLYFGSSGDLPLTR